jgi:hypothetical protein
MNSRFPGLRRFNLKSKIILVQDTFFAFLTVYKNKNTAEAFSRIFSNRKGAKGAKTDSSDPKSKITGGSAAYTGRNLGRVILRSLYRSKPGRAFPRGLGRLESR